jgi:hypothetical protein
MIKLLVQMNEKQTNEKKKKKKKRVFTLAIYQGCTLKSSIKKYHFT